MTGFAGVEENKEIEDGLAASKALNESRPRRLRCPRHLMSLALPAIQRVSSSVPSLEQRHGPVSRRVSVARRQRRDNGPWCMDLQVSRRLSHRAVAF